MAARPSSSRPVTGTSPTPSGRVQEVRGAGVVGEEPVIPPGESFEYTSGVPLQTPSGFMAGSYGMVTDDGEHFDIEIPAFSLDSVARIAHDQLIAPGADRAVLLFQPVAGVTAHALSQQPRRASQPPIGTHLAPSPLIYRNAKRTICFNLEKTR